jgi:SAM-dependent methyltransferase
MSFIAITFIILVIIGVSVAWTNFLGAPWAPSSMRTVHKMLTIAEVSHDDLVYDLGCGDGRTIITAARRYGARAVGIEVDPLRYLWCQVLVSIFRLRDRVQVIFGDFFSQDLSDADVVACYLLQDTNNKLEKKFDKELKPGTRVVSNTFIFWGMQKIREDGDVRLYLSHPPDGE